MPQSMLSLSLEELQSRLHRLLGAQVLDCTLAHQELTLTVAAENVLAVSRQLHDAPELAFVQLIDIAGVDYQQYGCAEWDTETASGSGFDRAVASGVQPQADTQLSTQRFALVYHLLSIAHNVRLRLKVFLPEDNLLVDSVCAIWAAADWYEREAFDLYGFLFRNHPDLRRILTDYGFKGHPMRKDFPLSGHVEVRYDAASQRVVYEPVDIEPRVLVPKIIRDDNRYATAADPAATPSPAEEAKS